jgi:thiamine biosynthesis protein ThiS
MLTLQINGQSRTLNLSGNPTLELVLQELAIKSDRVAVEHNGNIAPRTIWPDTTLAEGDRLEIVHFVGGGLFLPNHP